MPERSPTVRISPSAAAWLADPAGLHAIGDHFANSFSKAFAPIAAQATAGIAAACARAFPAVEPPPEELFLAPARSPMAVATDHLEAVLIREVRPVAASASSIDRSVANMAKLPRLRRVRLAFEALGWFTGVVGAVGAVAVVVHWVSSLIR